MEYRYFSSHKKGTKFSTLSGDLRRAIETQANIDLEARKRSRYLGQSFQAKSVQDYFFNDKCEKYANSSEEELTKLKILDSKALYLFPLQKDRFAYWEKQAKEQAQRIDKNIEYQMAEHYMSYN